MQRISELLSFLPFRFPFLWLDAIVEHEPGKRVVALKNLSWGEEVFQGHLPGEGILPGSLLIEMGFQASMLALCDFKQATQGPKIVRALKVEQFKFLHPAQPGDRLFVEVGVDSELIGMMTTKVKISNDAQKVIGTGTLIVAEVAAHVHPS